MSGFILKRFNTLINHKFDLTVSGCLYDNSILRDQDFRELGIEYPDRLNKSVNKRKAEYLAGRLSAKQCLATLGLHNFFIDADNNRCPIWPSNIKGSITHTSNIAIALISNHQTITGLGVDIEPVVTLAKAKKIQSQILFSQAEINLFNESLDKAMTFTLIFSAKESFFKAAYPQVGSFFGFKTIDVFNIETESGYCEFELNTTLSSNLLKGMRFKCDFRKFRNNIITLCLLS